MDEGAGRMPWLNLLAEDDLQFVGVFGFYEWKDGVVESVEQFRGELKKID